MKKIIFIMLSIISVFFVTDRVYAFSSITIDNVYYTDNGMVKNLNKNVFNNLFNGNNISEINFRMVVKDLSASDLQNIHFKLNVCYNASATPPSSYYSYAAEDFFINSVNLYNLSFKSSNKADCTVTGGYAGYTGTFEWDFLNGGSSFETVDIPVKFNFKGNAYSFYEVQRFTYAYQDPVVSSIDKNLDDLNQNQQQTNNKLDDLNNNLTNDNIDSSSANGFFNNFEDNDYGLSSIITAPLKLVQKLNNSQCSELSLPLPYVSNQNLKLPCMSTYYKSNFNSLFTLYQTITTGFIAYWIAVRIYALVKGFKDPEDDKIEVMDL